MDIAKIAIIEQLSVNNGTSNKPQSKPVSLILIFLKEVEDINKVLRWCMDHKLLASEMECPGCPAQCRQVKRARYDSNV